TLVRANQNDDRLSHSLLPQNATELETTRGYQHPLHGRTKTWQNESKDMKSISRMRTSGVTSPLVRKKISARQFSITAAAGRSSGNGRLVACAFGLAGASPSGAGCPQRGRRLSRCLADANARRSRQQAFKRESGRAFLPPRMNPYPG